MEDDDDGIRSHQNKLMFVLTIIRQELGGREEVTARANHLIERFKIGHTLP